MEHNEASELLSEFHDGELPPQRRLEMEGHLSVCPECRQTLDIWRRTASRLFAAKTPSTSIQTAVFAQRIMDRIEETTQSRSFGWARPWSPRWLMPALAVGLAATFFFVLPGSRSAQDPVEALMQQDDAGTNFLSWLSGPAPSKGDAFSVMVGEQ
jgi:anti-sigma factor RsiW